MKYHIVNSLRELITCEEINLYMILLFLLYDVLPQLGICVIFCHPLSIKVQKTFYENDYPYSSIFSVSDSLIELTDRWKVIT